LQPTFSCRRRGPIFRFAPSEVTRMLLEPPPAKRAATRKKPEKLFQRARISLPI